MIELQKEINIALSEKDFLIDVVCRDCEIRKQFNNDIKVKCENFELEFSRGSTIFPFDDNSPIYINGRCKVIIKK